MRQMNPRIVRVITTSTRVNPVVERTFPPLVRKLLLNLFLALSRSDAETSLEA
jgi:hypothetical protein